MNYMVSLVISVLDVGSWVSRLIRAARFAGLPQQPLYMSTALLNLLQELGSTTDVHNRMLSG